SMRPSLPASAAATPRPLTRNGASTPRAAPYPEAAGASTRTCSASAASFVTGMAPAASTRSGRPEFARSTQEAPQPAKPVPSAASNAGRAFANVEPDRRNAAVASPREFVTTSVPSSDAIPMPANGSATCSAVARSSNRKPSPAGSAFAPPGHGTFTYSWFGSSSFATYRSGRPSSLTKSRSRTPARFVGNPASEPGTGSFGSEYPATNTSGRPSPLTSATAAPVYHPW